jgi:hypothetical protein
VRVCEREPRRLEPLLERVEASAIFNLAFGLSDRPHGESPDVSPVPSADLEFGTVRVRQTNKRVRARRAGNPRLANRNGVATIEPLRRGPGVVAGKHRSSST